MLKFAWKCRQVFFFISALVFSHDSLLAQTIKIGKQHWSTSNLDVITYRNGDTIPQVQDATEWANLKTGAWCYYDNDEEHGDKHGKLYNWYAVVDPRGLAPLGFHIPSQDEWLKLINYLGKNAGTKLKSTQGWALFGNGTNESGFNAFPAGCRKYDGVFAYKGNQGYWSSTTEHNEYNVWLLSLSSSLAGIIKLSDGKANGFSVRCVKD